MVKESASGVNDSPPDLLALLKDRQATRIVLRAKTVCPVSVSAIWKRFEKYKPEPLKSRVLAENSSEDTIADLVAVVFSFTARLYGQRRAKCKTERIVHE